MIQTQDHDLKQAHSYFEQGNWAQAKSAYEIFLERRDNAFARARLGTIHRSIGSLFESLQHFQRAVELDPKESWRARTHLGAPGAMDLDPYRKRLDEAREWVAQWNERVVRVFR